MLTGRSELPRGFNPSRPLSSDHASIAAIAGAVTQPRNNLPPAVVLPEKLIHIDINADVFDKNYPAEVKLHGDASEVLFDILNELKEMELLEREGGQKKMDRIKEDKEKYLHSWTEQKSREKVTPGFFFKSLRKQIRDDAYIVADDGDDEGEDSDEPGR